MIATPESNATVRHSLSRRLLRVGLVVCAMLLGACSQPPLGPLEVVELDTPAGDFSGQAHLAATPSGTAVLSWLEPTTGEGMGLMYASLPTDSETWSEPRMLAEGEDWFINWADLPSVVPMTDTVWAAHWLVFQEDFEGYDIVVALSQDRGQSWGEPFALNTDGTSTEHGFVTLYPAGENIAAVWLDGRNMFVDGEFTYELALRVVRLGRRAADRYVRRRPRLRLLPARYRFYRR